MTRAFAAGIVAAVRAFSILLMCFRLRPGVYVAGLASCLRMHFNSTFSQPPEPV